VEFKKKKKVVKKKYLGGSAWN